MSDARRTVLDTAPGAIHLRPDIERAWQTARRIGLSFFIYDGKLYEMDGGALARAAGAMAAGASRLDPTERRTWQPCSWNASWRDATDYEVKLWNSLMGAVR